MKKDPYYKGILNSLGTYYHPKNVFILEEILSSQPDSKISAIYQSFPELNKKQG